MSTAANIMGSGLAQGAAGIQAGLGLADALEPGLSPFEVFQRLGALTRKLHDAIQALGYSTEIEKSVQSLPDARARLGYIADLTGKAADRVLSAAEEGREIQERIEKDAKALAEGWKKSGPPDPELVASTREFLESLPEHAGETNARLSDIILAQDFHDLTGQTIQRVVKLATNLEEQLLKLLLETTPPENREVVQSTELAGPAVPGLAGADTVTGQAQVDDLLSSLGF